MSDKLARILAGLALLGVMVDVGLSWQASGHLARLERRVGELESEGATAAAFLKGVAKNRTGVPHPATAPDEAARMRAAKGRSRKAPPRVVAEELEDRDARRDARRDRRREKLRTILDSEIGSFAEENGLDEDTELLIVDELMLLREGSALIRDDMREDQMTRFEGRAELQALREDSDARLIEILGEDMAAALRARLADEREARKQ